jgi:hypothetical protein
MEQKISLNSKFSSFIICCFKIPRAKKLVGFFLLVSSFFFSCTTKTLESERILQKDGRSQVFFQTYDNVWRAVQLSLKYPIAINNIDQGVIETEQIDGLAGFMLPNQKPKKLEGVRYKIVIRVINGEKANRPSSQVIVRKVLLKNKDFFSEPVALESDGYEEAAILYRVNRELVVDEALKAAAEKGLLN